MAFSPSARSSDTSESSCASSSAISKNTRARPAPPIRAFAAAGTEAGEGNAPGMCSGESVHTHAVCDVAENKERQEIPHLVSVTASQSQDEHGGGMEKNVEDAPRERAAAFWLSALGLGVLGAARDRVWNWGTS